MNEFELFRQVYRLNFKEKYMNRTHKNEFYEFDLYRFVMSANIEQVVDTFYPGDDFEYTRLAGEHFVLIGLRIEKEIIMADENCTIYLCTNNSSEVVETFTIGKGKTLEMYFPVPQREIGDFLSTGDTGGDTIQVYVSGENAKAIKLNIKLLFMKLEEK